MKNTLFYPSANFFRITSIIFLSLILSFPFLEVNGETATNAANTNSSVEVPVYVATWIKNELSKATRKTLLTKDDFFTKDSARVVGYIAGYHADLGFATVTLDASNDLTFEKRPIVTIIDSMGRFACAIAMNHPRMITISFGEEFMDLYLEPGQTLPISFDWNDCVRTNCFRDVKEANQVLLFQGPLARLNYELNAFQLKSFMYKHNYILKKSPQEYLTALDSILVENEARVKAALASGKYMKKAIEIKKNEALIEYGYCLLDYAGMKDKNNGEFPSSFYKKLKLVPLNDPTCIISGTYNMFINRFETSPVMHKAYEKGKSGRNDELSVWKRKDALLKSDFNVSNNFCYEVTKIRRLSFEFESMQKKEAYDYYYALQAGIKLSFLKQEGFRILTSRFGNDNKANNKSDGGLSLPENTAEQPKWSPRSLSKGVDADIFKRLMARHKGKYVFVDFWGTSCGPCRSSINGQKGTREKYANNPDFDFVFITCKDWSPNKNVYDNYVKEQSLKHSYFISNDDFNYMMQLFRFTGVPHYVFIDPVGHVLDADFSRLGFEDAIKLIQDK